MKSYKSFSILPAGDDIFVFEFRKTHRAKGLLLFSYFCHWPFKHLTEHPEKNTCHKQQRGSFREQ